MVSTEVLIVGGGLSGCLVARQLTEHGIDFQLIDARDRLGGRILSSTLAGKRCTSAAVDLGPSWFWPHQHSLIKLIKSLGLEQSVYEQSHAGDSIIEYANGQVEARAGAASMAGSYRLDSGMQTLIDNIAAKVSDGAIRLNSRLTEIAEKKDLLTATVETQSGRHLIDCRRIVLAVPPRLFSASVIWPGSDTAYRSALESVATWMATEAKIMLVYDASFWLQKGLSGDAISQIGPMAEVHDATPRNSDQGVLFGFLMARPEQRLHQHETIKNQAAEQVRRLFGKDVSPLEILYKDWSTDELTATNIDRLGHRAHPDASDLLLPGFEQRIVWAVSEVATQDAGYLEGAVRAANTAVKQLVNNL